MSEETISATRGLSRYRELLALPGVGRIVLAGIISRLPSSMLPLALPLVVVGRTGSYVSAGLVTAIFTIASGIVSPLRGRLVDRVGAPVVLMITGWGQALALIGVVAIVSATSSVVGLAAIGALTGALTPPISPVMRGWWSRLERQDLRDAAFAFESISTDIFYIIGPSLVAFLIAIAPIDVTLIVSAILCVVGTSVLALAPGVKTAPPIARATHWLGPLRSSAVRRLLPLAVLLTGSLTAVDLGVIAFTSAHHAKALAGVLIAAMSVGSIMGGVYWGSRVQPGPLRRQLTILLCVLTAGMLLLANATSVLWLGALSILVGLALSPSITVEYSIMDAVAPATEITESFAWMSTASQVGEAAAVAIAGLFVTRLDNHGGYVVAAVLVGAGALYCALLAPDINQRPDG